jgi:hypothetical protein
LKELREEREEEIDATMKKDLLHRSSDHHQTTNKKTFGGERKEIARLDLLKLISER